MHGLSMASAEFVDEILARMTALEISQSALARVIGVSQPHLSRVLSKQLIAGKKTRSQLEKWMAGQPISGASSSAPPPTAAELEFLIRRLSTTPAEQRMHVMQMLRAIDAMVGKG